MSENPLNLPTLNSFHQRELWRTAYASMVAEAAQETGYVAFSPKNPKPNTVYIYGQFVDESEASIRRRWFGDTNFTSFSSFMAQMNKVTGDKLTLRINSPGGSIPEASRCRLVLQEFKQSGGTIDSLVEGMECSAATLLTALSDYRQIADMGCIMIHNPRMPVFMYERLDVRGFDKIIANLEAKRSFLLSGTDTVASIYAECSGYSVKRCRELMERETYMTAKMAVDMGFADSIFG